MFKLLILIVLTISTSFAAETEYIHIKKANCVIIDQSISKPYMAEKSLEILEKSNNLPLTENLYLFMNTPGGDLEAGLLFVDVIKGLKRPVHTITLFSGSMGYIMTQLLDTRYVLNSGTYYHHLIQVPQTGGAIYGNLSGYIRAVEKISDDLNSVLAKRVKLSRREFYKLVEHDYSVVGISAIKENHADRLAIVTCDNDMLQFSDKIQNNIFHQVHECPLVTANVGTGTYGKEAVSVLKTLKALIGL